MKPLKIVIAAAILFGFYGCDNENSETLSNLAEIDILGTWEINSQTINGVNDLSVQCCEFTEFAEDDNPNDYKGTYRTYGPGYESSGTFVIDVESSTMTWGEAPDQLVYKYEIQDEYLTVEYIQDDTTIELTYIRRD